MMKITGRIIKILLLLFVLFCFLIVLFLEIQNENKNFRHINLYSKHKNQPIPDVIEMAPSVKYTQTATLNYKRVKDHKGFLAALKGKDALKITKRHGQYYWDSQGGVPLLMMTEDHKSFKYTIFVAYDASGVIVIKHDNSMPHYCHLYTSGYYREYRLPKREWFLGGVGFFPPKPDGWCDSLNEYMERHRDNNSILNYIFSYFN